MAASAVTLVLSFALRDRLPSPAATPAELRQAPIQTDNDLPEPFEVTRKGVTYVVTPYFNYELWGMVVSLHDASSFLDISHKAWNDNINIRDFCVLWGRNLETGAYKRMRFHNRDFTCYYSYPDAETGELFAGDCFSNNHILPADSAVTDAARRARRGDSIHFKGWLVSYGIKGSPYKRMTSTSRNDTGNGACEVVYVNEFEVLRTANPGWRALNKLSIGVLVVCAAFLFFA